MAETTPPGGTAARALAVTTAAGSALAAYGWLEARWHRLRHVHLAGVTDAGTPPLRILHISDLHLTRRHGRVADFVARLADETYDLVVATGDLLGDVGMEERVPSVLAPLTIDRPGVVVLGSNDVWAPTPGNPFAYFTGPSDGRGAGRRLDTATMIAGLERSNWTVLRNVGTSVVIGGGRVAISAVDDPHDRATTIPDVSTIIPPPDPALLHLGLVHAPYLDALDRLVDAGAQLLLAGHTHGGQVRVPGIGALVDNCDLPLQQARGMSTHRDVPLHVSAGLGTSKYAPIRFACRPEATLLTLLP